MNDEEFDENGVRESLMELVKEGKLALILSQDVGGNIEDRYINGHQVIVRCPHCMELTNVGKMNPKPQGEREKGCQK